MSTSRKQITNRALRTLYPHEKWNLRCKIRNARLKSRGKRAGYKSMDVKTSPFSKAISELCMPQPRQAMPKYF
jgi:hypothetical protein